MPLTESMTAVLGERATQTRRWFEIPVLVAALAVVPVIFLEERATTDWHLDIAAAANWGIWSVFLIEYLVVVSLADSRWGFTRKAWLDVVIIVVSFPALPGLLAATRLVRLTRLARALRILRFVRLAAILSRGGQAAGVIFRKRALGYVITLTFLLALGIGGAFAVVEDTPIADGMWWAVVTLTTVGYGDVYPVTGVGRLAAGLLMMLGIGVVAFITASVAAYFVDEDDLGPSVQERIDALDARLARIEGHLTRNHPDSPESP